jgi:competence protein ComEA
MVSQSDTRQAASTPRPEPRADRPEGFPDPAGRLVNINTATEAELEALPGIGPGIARRIVEGRPYRSFEELERIKAIGKKRLEEIRPLVTTD